MDCPLRMDGVHDLGGSMMCGCGYVLTIPPISVSISICNKSEILVDEAFNCSTVDGAIGALEKAIRQLQGGVA